MSTSVDRPTPRLRRRPLTGDDRRAAIIESSLPLLAERGPAVTSAELAEAAEVAQGTIFHVFTDKQALVDAAVRQVMDVGPLAEALDRLIEEPDLLTRLAMCVDLVTAHLVRAMPVLMKCGIVKDKGVHPTLVLRRSIARLFEPDAASLANPPSQLAAILLGLCLASAQETVFGDSQMPSSRDLAALFLDGARIRVTS